MNQESLRLQARECQGKMVREAIDKTGALGDADTADLYTGISRAIDQRLWFLESHLQGN